MAKVTEVTDNAHATGVKLLDAASEAEVVDLLDEHTRAEAAAMDVRLELLPVPHLVVFTELNTAIAADYALNIAEARGRTLAPWLRNQLERCVATCTPVTLGLLPQTLEMMRMHASARRIVRAALEDARRG